LFGFVPIPPSVEDVELCVCCYPSCVEVIVMEFGLVPYPSYEEVIVVVWLSALSL